MKTTYLRAGAVAAMALAAAGCVPRTAPPPRPVPAPVATSAAPAPPLAPAPSNWLDVPATPGDWTYRFSQGGGIASFGARPAEPLLVMRCDRAQGQVHVERVGQGAGSTMTLRAETMTRTLPAQPVAQPTQAFRASLGANDRLLDAMALSKGRFMIETSGLPPLYLPAWPEVTRVVEDCRS